MLRYKIFKFIYKKILRPFLYSLNPEIVHVWFIKLGRLLGKSSITKQITRSSFQYSNSKLIQEIEGIEFKNPIGLSAGFDYEANLGQIVSEVGFGYASMGTITNTGYDGNPRPMLQRLIKSEALLVNKGFKNLGADKTIQKLSKENFVIPIGISIGRTNSATLKTINQSINDIVETFEKFEAKALNNKYYELNISCPNLINVSNDLNFYDPKRLKALLCELKKLRICKPIFIKMPISLDEETIKLLLKEIVAQNFKIVIFGNLESNRMNPAVKDRISALSKGNISGKPTFQPSNKFIRLAYESFGNDLKIIGCGGVFNAQDAYTKIKLGASLIQLITGMIYEGPQLIGQINYELVRLLENDGYSNISEAVGVDVKRSRP